MAKRRYNHKKIANTPLLKKRMAKFCSWVEVKYNKPDFEEILFKGNRGFISMDENDLAKEFDKRLDIVREKYAPLRIADEEQKAGSRWYRQADGLAELSMWHEEGLSIANEIFEEQFLS